MAGSPGPGSAGPVLSGLPGDSHVHTEWSWDTVAGSMVGSCARAVELGLASIAFTEHADFTEWRIEPHEEELLEPRFRAGLRPGGILAAPPLDAGGYLACVAECRDRFPGLRILSGLELGEPHWYPERVAALLGAGEFDRRLGSVHTLGTALGPRPVDVAFGDRPANDVVRDYLAEVVRLAESTAPFHILAHLDYPIRYWPAADGPFCPAAVEDELRAALRALAASGRALEINTRVPLAPELVVWWAECGGRTVSFGSDAHRPAKVADGFAAAVAAAEAAGFRPGETPVDLWWRPGA